MTYPEIIFAELISGNLHISRNTTRQAPIKAPIPSHQQAFAAGTMSAHGATTEGSGASPMSILWTVLPMELVHAILKKTLPQDIDMQVSFAFGPREHDWTPKNEARSIYDLRSLSGEWDTVSTLTRICHTTREFALQAMKDSTQVHAPRFYGQDTARSVYSEWIQCCNSIVFEHETFVDSDPHPEDWYKGRTAMMRLLFSISKENHTSDAPLPKLTWLINTKNATHQQLLQLFTYMRKEDNITRTRFEQAMLRPRGPVLWDGYEEWKSPYECIFSNPLLDVPRDVMTRWSKDPRNMTISHRVHEDWEIGDDKWEDIDVKGLEQMVEDVGRREMLEVLWVFLPYFQPEAAQLEELGNVDCE